MQEHCVYKQQMLLEYYNPPSLFTPLDFGLVGFSFACGLGVKLQNQKKLLLVYG
jgi:thiamine pyrophosphate-dependent acetolactate synthase large subunit-like protein